MELNASNKEEFDNVISTTEAKADPELLWTKLNWLHRTKSFWVFLTLEFLALYNVYNMDINTKPTQSYTKPGIGKKKKSFVAEFSQVSLVCLFYSVNKIVGY